MIKSDAFNASEALKGDLAALNNDWAKLKNNIQESSILLESINLDIRDARKVLETIKSLKEPLVNDLEKKIEEKTKELRSLEHYYQTYETRASEKKNDLSLQIEQNIAALKSLETQKGIVSNELNRLEKKQLDLGVVIGEKERLVDVLAAREQKLKNTISSIEEREKDVSHREYAVGLREVKNMNWEKDLQVKEEVTDEMYSVIKEKYKNGLYK